MQIATDEAATDQRLSIPEFAGLWSMNEVALVRNRNSPLRWLCASLLLAKTSTCDKKARFKLRTTADARC